MRYDQGQVFVMGTEAKLRFMDISKDKALTTSGHQLFMLEAVVTNAVAKELMAAWDSEEGGGSGPSWAAAINTGKVRDRQLNEVQLKNQRLEKRLHELLTTLAIRTLRRNPLDDDIDNL